MIYKFDIIKVQIRIQDETGLASFWLFQQEVCKLIGKSAGCLIAKAKKVRISKLDMLNEISIYE